MILHNDVFSSFQKTRRGRPAGSTKQAKFMAKQIPLFTELLDHRSPRIDVLAVAEKRRQQYEEIILDYSVFPDKPLIISFRTPDHE